MKRVILVVAALAFGSPALAQVSFQATPDNIVIGQTLIGGPIPVCGSPPVTPCSPAPPPAPTTSFINVGQLLGPAVQQVLTDIAYALVSAFMGWLFLTLRTKFNIDVDQQHRDAITSAVQRQAGSLISDGMVHVEGAKVQVKDAALAESANEVLAVIPDAVQHFGISGDDIAKRIVDAIPQIAAGAAMIAATKPVPNAGPGGPNGGTAAA